MNGIVLSKLNIRLNTLFGATNVGKAFGEQINSFVKRFLHGDTSYLNLVNTFFSLGALDYTSLYDLLDRVLLQKYWNNARDEALNATVADFLLDFSTDEDPALMGDYGATWNANVRTPEATKENFRIPTMITVTPGETPFSAGVSWYTKYSVTESDIRIRGIGENGEETPFTGTVETAEETVMRHYPGIDLGFTGFLGLTFPMVRHTAKITGMTPGGQYAFTVGSEKRGWWSEEGLITAPDGSNEVDLLHFSDPECDNKKQYEETWANTVKQAFALYPNADLAAVTGNLTPNGMHVHQWQWLLDTPADTLNKTYLLPAAGKTEAKDENTLAAHFVLPNVSSASAETGPAYSVDHNNAHIAVLNTNDVTEDGLLSDEQIEWLKTDLAASSAAWKIVMMNAAVYASSTNYSDKKVTALRKQLSSLLPELGADLVVQGGDCVYTRTAPLANNRHALSGVTYLRGEDGAKYKTFSEPRGTVWAEIGSAGTARGAAAPAGTFDLNYPLPDRAAAPDAPMFSAIRIRGGVLYFDAYTVEGETVTKTDSFAIRKNADEGDELPLKEWPAPEFDFAFPATRLTKFLNILVRLFKALNNFMKVFAFGSTEIPAFNLPEFTLPEISLPDRIC